jgi:hypothetical protein
MNLADIVSVAWLIIRAVADVLGVALGGLIGIYMIPGSPLRKWVDARIDAHVSHRFHRELEEFKHKLGIEADRLRAEHERQLRNASIVIERKHEVFRELFRLIHIAVGAAARLFGMREDPTFEDHSREDVRKLLNEMHVADGVSEPILAQWDDSRAEAIRELNRVRRRVEIVEADRDYAEAWNYYLANSLYLTEPISEKAESVFAAARDVISVAKFPEGARRRDSGQHKRDVSERLEELRILLRADLGVVSNLPEPQGPAA